MKTHLVIDGQELEHLTLLTLARFIRPDEQWQPAHRCWTSTQRWGIPADRGWSLIRQQAVTPVTAPLAVESAGRPAEFIATAE